MIIDWLRKIFSLEFQNKEIELQYQCNMQKYMLKVVKYYILIFIAVQCIAIVDQILDQEYFMITLFIPALLVNCLVYYFLKSRPSTIIYYQLYIGIISFLASNLQIAFLHIKQFKISDTQFFVYLDLIHQFILLFNFGQSHYKTSFLYFYFLLTRFYVHIQMGFKNLSLAFLFFGLLFFIDQYYKAKLRRKQFLKGKRNKALEYLIQEFIDEQVCIIQKDETNVKFLPIIINNKLKEMTQDINRLIQQVKIPIYKNNLQNYLYQSNKEKETLLCQYNQEIYEITYWKFIIKHQKVFIRIKKISQKCSQIVNYQQICQYYQKKLSSIENQSQIVKRFVSQIRLNTFMFCFNKYYTLYKCNFQYYSHEKIIQLLQQKGFKINSDVMKPLQTDMQLLNLLLNLIQTLMNEKSVFISQKKNLWMLNFLGRFRKDQFYVNQVITLVDKILFLIGYGNTQLIFEEGLIKVVIINKKYTKFK